MLMIKDHVKMLMIHVVVFNATFRTTPIFSALLTLNHCRRHGVSAAMWAICIAREFEGLLGTRHYSTLIQ